MNDSPQFEALSTVQAMAIVQALAIARGQEGITDIDAQQVLDWAERAVFDFRCLELVLAGHIVPNIDEHGELCFQLTPEGHAQGVILQIQERMA